MTLDELKEIIASDEGVSVECKESTGQRVEACNFGDAAMIDRQDAVRKLFSSLDGDNKYQLDINRNRGRTVRLLDDFEKDVGNGHKTRCDYFDLYALGQATVKGEQEIAQ